MREVRKIQLTPLKKIHCRSALILPHIVILLVGLQFTFWTSSIMCWINYWVEIVDNLATYHTQIEVGLLSDLDSVFSDSSICLVQCSLCIVVDFDLCEFRSIQNLHPSRMVSLVCHFRHKYLWNSVVENEGWKTCSWLHTNRLLCCMVLWSALKMTAL